MEGDEGIVAVCEIGLCRLAVVAGLCMGGRDREILEYSTWL